MERILLRPLRPSDAEPLGHYVRDQRVRRNILLPRDYPPEETALFIRRARGEDRRNVARHRAIIHREDAAVIGSISLMRWDATHRRAELGYWIASPYWRQGLGREAVRRMLDLGFREMRLMKAFAMTLPSNRPSEKLLGSAGFVLTATLRRHVKVRGRWQDLHYWELLEPEWRARRKDRA